MRSVRWTCILVAAAVVAGVLVLTSFASAEEESLEVAFGEVDITPPLEEGRPVWLAGYGMGRRATSVHDPIMARCLVLKSNHTTIALVSVDLVGLQYPDVCRIRARLPDVNYVMVSSTHNHEGPDVIGIWGRSPVQRGVDDGYIDTVVGRVSRIVGETLGKMVPAKVVRFGAAEDESLLRDTREPIVKDGVIRTLRFLNSEQKTLGLVVDWSSHPEAMGAKNTAITADFPSATVARLREKYSAPVVYFSGAVGGLMTPPRNRIKDQQGKPLEEGDFAYMTRYGEEVGDLAAKAIDASTPIKLTPLQVVAKPIYLPVENPLYRAASAIRVLDRQATVWTGDKDRKGEPLTASNADQTMAVETEVAYVRMGDLHLACIPGELYPELVYGRFQNPVDPNVDFPEAPLEPNVAGLMPGKHWMMIGLANDEVGYIIPRRQWDRAPPFAYGRKEGQYGEVNSCGSQVAPLIMATLADCVAGAK